MSSDRDLLFKAPYKMHSVRGGYIVGHIFWHIMGENEGGIWIDYVRRIYLAFEKL